MLLFQSAMPSLGVGRLRLRGDVPSIYNTDREHTLRIAEEPFYKTTAAEFSRSQICVDVFSFASRYCDLASIGGRCRQCKMLLSMIVYAQDTATWHRYVSVQRMVSAMCMVATCDISLPCYDNHMSFYLPLYPPPSSRPFSTPLRHSGALHWRAAVPLPRVQACQRRGEAAPHVGAEPHTRDCVGVGDAHPVQQR